MRLEKFREPWMEVVTDVGGGRMELDSIGGLPGPNTWGGMVDENLAIVLLPETGEEVRLDMVAIASASGIPNDEWGRYYGGSATKPNINNVRMFFSWSTGELRLVGWHWLGDGPRRHLLVKIGTGYRVPDAFRLQMIAAMNYPL